MELGTLGRGNHFLEVQRDDEGALWLLVHSGSRVMGPAIRNSSARGVLIGSAGRADAHLAPPRSLG
jgi:RNA-splicing ligase RtcB